MILKAMPGKLLRARGAATLVAMGHDSTGMLRQRQSWSVLLGAFPSIAKIAEIAKDRRNRFEPAMHSGAQISIWIFWHFWHSWQRRCV